MISVDLANQHCTRREILRSAVAAAAATTLPAWFLDNSGAPVYADETSPNNRPRVALIGCGGMGTGDAKNAQRFGDIVADCDVDKGHIAKALATFKGATAYHDYREVCDLPSVDVILNGTPDHWHTLVNLRALRSGKDVYSEKPLTLTIDEGKHVVEAVKKSDRILQTGTQQRSDKTFRLACELVRNGRLGTIERVHVWLPQGRREGPFHTRTVPTELDWDFWQGQTPAVDYLPERCHGNFRYWWDYAGGTIADWGAHHNDIALWGLGQEHSGPVSVEGRALIEPIPKGYTAASQFEVKYVYDDGVEHICRSTSANGPAGAVIGQPKEGEKYHGVQFEGPRGWIFVTRDGKLDASDPDLITTPLGTDAERLYASDDHMGNFFDCVKNRKPPICPAEIGHRSASVCHLGVISIRLGRKLDWNPAEQHFVDDAEADSFLFREMRNPYLYEA
jgi:predicted dehydrogenase